MAEVKKNENSFEVYQDDKSVGIMEFQEKENGVLDITHTEVDKEQSGKGLGRNLVDAAVDYARKEGKKLTATCSYAKSVLDKDSSVKDVYVD